MTDDELKLMLRTWQAPPAPESLRVRVLRRRWLSLPWLLSGDIRIPVPVALAVLCLILFVVYRAARPASATLSDFEQVTDFQPRIVRTAHEIR